MAGIKEIAEIGAFAREIVKFAAERLADGAGTDDLFALVTKVLTDEAFVQKAQLAIENAGAAAGELADLDREEAKFVTALGIDIAYDIIDAVKK